MKRWVPFALLILTVGVVFGTTSCSDKCKGVNCANGGYCSSGHCVCPIGFGGKSCSLWQFPGNWHGTDTFISNLPDTSKYFTSGTDSMNISIAVIMPGDTLVNISNVLGQTGVSIIGSRNHGGNIISFSNQILAGIGDTLNGNFTILDSNTFQDNYTVNTPNGVVTYNGTFTK
jgi:hypothetical protein